MLLFSQPRRRARGATWGRIMKKIALVLCAALLSTPALASNFDGPYGGFDLGYVRGHDKGHEFSSGVPDTYAQKTLPGGALFGGVLGYNKVLGNNFVVGLEGDAELRVASDNNVQHNSGAPDARYPTKTSLRNALSVRPRLGYVFYQDTSMVFVSAGFASAGVRRTFSDASIPQSQSSTKQENGWTAGLGLDHIISTNMALRVEGRYSDYGRDNVSANVVFGAGYVERQSYREETLRTALLFHF